MLKFPLALLCVFCAYACTLEAQMADCLENHRISQNDSLRSLAKAKYSSDDYPDSIWLATEARAGTLNFPDIADPLRLVSGEHVCIPQLQEAQHWQQRYDQYRQATSITARPNAAQESTLLLTISDPTEVRFVTWMTTEASDQLAAVAAEPENVVWKRAPQELWLTVVPQIRNFCQAYSKTRSTTQDALRERLEERLGLPPASRYDYFVEVKVKDTLTRVIRPCSDQSILRANCHATTCAALASETDRSCSFVRRTLRETHDPTKAVQYPWTSLGYTFDWALKDQGDFVRFGESEFYAPAGSLIQIVNTFPTSTYCSLTSTTFH